MPLTLERCLQLIDECRRCFSPTAAQLEARRLARVTEEFVL
jgi:hypothetical protein